jgi:hypothetical protein
LFGEKEQFYWSSYNDVYVSVDTENLQIHYLISIWNWFSYFISKKKKKLVEGYKIKLLYYQQLNRIGPQTNLSDNFFSSCSLPQYKYNILLSNTTMTTTSASQRRFFFKKINCTLGISFPFFWFIVQAFPTFFFLHPFVW